MYYGRTILGFFTIHRSTQTGNIFLFIHKAHVTTKHVVGKRSTRVSVNNWAGPLITRMPFSLPCLLSRAPFGCPPARDVSELPALWCNKTIMNRLGLKETILTEVKQMF